MNGMMSLMAPERLPHLCAWRQLSGEDRSRQPVVGAAVHDRLPLLIAALRNCPRQLHSLAGRSTAEPSH